MRERIVRLKKAGEAAAVAGKPLTKHTLSQVESKLGSDFAVDFGTKYPSKVVGDAVAVATKMHAKYKAQFASCAPAEL